MIHSHDHNKEHLGEYRLLRQLGRGGFSIIYLAEHLYEHTLVAVKILQVPLTSKDAWKEFLNEARGFRLQHPHIIPLLDFGISHDEKPFLVMEYVPGGSLREQTGKGKRLPLATIVAYTKQLASALQYAHDRRLIHRDVKPENMLQREDGTIVLSDFGIAHILDQSNLISGFPRAGTLAYMAPEQGMGRPCPASDQYALAVTVYEWITGRLPFTGGSMEIAIQHRLDPPPPLQAFNPAISSQVEQVILRALAKEPEARFATVAQFAQEIEHAIIAIEGEKASELQLASPLSPVPADRPFIPEPHSSTQVSLSSHKEPPQEETTFAPQTPILLPPNNPSTRLPERNKAPVRQQRVLLLLLIILLIIALPPAIVTLRTPFLLQRGTLSASQLTATQSIKRPNPTVKATNSGTTTPISRITPALVAPAGWRQVLNDPLTASNHDSSWEMDDTCVFHPKYYEQISTGLNYCAHGSLSFPTTVYSDLLFSLDLSIQRGNQAGLVFRNRQNNYYYFSITTSGDYVLEVHQRANGGQDIPVATGISSAIHRGQGQWNTLAVLAQGSTMKLYINTVLIAVTRDTNYTQGTICVAINGAGPQDVSGDAWFKNAGVWIP